MSSGSSRRQIRDGKQVELTDNWFRSGSPWLIHRPNIAFDVKLGGHTEYQYDGDGQSPATSAVGSGKGRAGYRLGHAGARLRR